MRLQRTGQAIGVSLIGLTLLLTAPDVGTSQEVVRSGLSADRPLSYHLSALSSNSWFSRNGIWVRHEGMWAFRPTLNYDWQPYFRCASASAHWRAGYGCAGVGLASHSFWSWVPYGYGGWDLVPGGWMWFPGQRLATSRAWDLFWDLWFVSPRHGFGEYGLGPSFSPHGGLVGIDQRSIPGQAASTSSTHTRDRTRAQVDPVRIGPVVTLNSDGKERGPSGRTAPTTPSIDPVRLGPRVEPRAEGVSQRSARQELEGKSGHPLDRERYRSRSADLGRFTPRAMRTWMESRLRSPTDPTVYRRGNSVKLSPVPSAASRRESPRSPATGQSKSKRKTAPEQ